MCDRPTDGTLYSLPVRAGDYVKVGDVLAEMADLQHVRVRAFVDEPDLGRLRPNQDVQVTWDAKPGRIWTGRTQQIPKQVVPHGMRSVGEVLCSVDNQKLELLPNINVEVTILVLRTERSFGGAARRPCAKTMENTTCFCLMARNFIGARSRWALPAHPSMRFFRDLTLNDRVALPGDRDLKDGMEVRPVEGSLIAVGRCEGRFEMLLC